MSILERGIGGGGYMTKKFEPEKYGMLPCPICDGHGRIQFLNHVAVCQTCGGFGFIRKEGETFDLRDKPISATVFKR